jgi:hypothetical protein
MKYSQHGTRRAPITSKHGANKVLHYAASNQMNYIDSKVLPNQDRALSYGPIAMLKSRK